MLSNRSQDQAAAQLTDRQIDGLSPEENEDKYLQQLEDELSQR